MSGFIIIIVIIFFNGNITEHTTLPQNACGTVRKQIGIFHKDICLCTYTLELLTRSFISHQHIESEHVAMKIRLYPVEAMKEKTRRCLHHNQLIPNYKTP